MALDNLIENALRYAPGSAVEVKVGRAGREVVVGVRDNGPGLGVGAGDRTAHRRAPRRFRHALVIARRRLQRRTAHPGRALGRADLTLRTGLNAR